MTRHLPNIAGAVLGLAFVFFGTVGFLMAEGYMDPPQEGMPEPGTPPALFMEASFGTGFMTFVKVFEVLGGLLVAFPKTRNWGLLVLGPIVITIFAYHATVMDGKDLFAPQVVAVCVLAAYLLWAERRAFLGLLKR